MKMLVITTDKDLSVNEFKTAAEMLKYEIHVSLYGENVQHVNNFDRIYLRDPFNTGDCNEARIRELLSNLVRDYPSARYIDECSTYEGLLIEDKWRQFELLSDFMPKTLLINNISDESEINDAKLRLGVRGKSSVIAKARISTRSRDVVLAKSDTKPELSYILQQRLNLVKEWRVYGVNGEILPTAAVRTSKTNGVKVRTKGVEELPTNLIGFAEDVYARIPQMDLVGFDIAITNDNKPVLLEINRSPQFKQYNQATGTNLANKFMKGLA